MPAAPSTARRRSILIWSIALAVPLLVAGLILLGGPDVRETADPAASLAPSILAGSPGGQAVANATPTPETTASAEPTPRPTPEPAATPAPATPALATPPPASPAPTPIVMAVAGPADAVAAFYGHVAAGRFDAAYGLWGERMRSVYPRRENLDDRFDQTASITFEQLYVAEQGATTATVQADFVETYDSGSSRRFIGYWRLILVEGRWVLDEPTY